MKAYRHSATGAEQLSSPKLIPDSCATAGQGVKNEGEPSCESQIQSGGAAISRRFFVRSIASIPVAAAAPASASLAQMADTPQADDAQLLALGGEYIVAEQRYLDLLLVLDEMSDRRDSPPEVLRIRPRDFALGRKAEEDAEFWCRPCDITQWRHLTERRTEKKETDDRLELVQWKIEPSEELRQRGAEIVAAFDEWRARKPPRIYEGPA
ncbi:hypothetical protein [Bradyrhizobium pachyrhizi]|uniref:hypothetical protein n=1 Tax=Bradyrhizobium pachyrhizi TaxID=280333 RepID=UPI00067D9490|nr:hypothetical protein [Bradyrhizobium pachyrhizi]